MAADLPSLPAGALDIAREAYQAGWVILNRPASVAGRTRKPGTPDDIAFTNFAYYLAYPAAAEKIAAGDAAGAAAWKRIHAGIVAALFAEPPAAAPAWKPSAPTWPLPTPPAAWTAGGSFGYRRPFKKTEPQTRYHCGVDLDAAAGTPVLAPEAGVVINPNAGWETRKKNGQLVGVKAVLLQTDSGLMVLLGGIKPDSAVVKKGERVQAGQQLAVIGNYPEGDSMLHVQMWESPANAPLSEKQINALKSWSVGEPRPQYLIDPASYLEAASTNPRYAPPPGFVGVKPGAGALVENVPGNEAAEGTPEGDVEDDTPSSPPATAEADSGAGVIVVAVAGALALGGIAAWLASRKKSRALRRAA